MNTVQPMMARKNALMGGTWLSCVEMLDRNADTIYTAYASNNLAKQGLQLQSALIEMSVQFHSLSGNQTRIVDIVHPAIAGWAGLSSKCSVCSESGHRHKSKDSLFLSLFFFQCN